MGNEGRKTGGYLASVIFAFAAGAAAILLSDKKKKEAARKTLLDFKKRLLETKDKLGSMSQSGKPKEGTTPKSNVSKTVKKQ